MPGEFTLEKKFASAFACVVALSIFGSVIVFMCFGESEDPVRWNTHSTDLLRTSDALLTDMLNMQTGVRAYVNSGDERFLDSYSQDIVRIEKSLDTLKSLTEEDPSQRERIAALYALYSNVHSMNEQLISMRHAVLAQTTTQSALTSYFGKVHDEQFMDAFRAKLAEFNNAETDLVEVRKDQAASLAKITIIVVVLAGVAIVLVSIGLGLFITRSILYVLGGA